MMINDKYLKSVKDTVVSTSQSITDYLKTDDSDSREKIAHDKLLHCLKTLLKQAKQKNQSWLYTSIKYSIFDFQHNWNIDKAFGGDFYVTWHLFNFELAELCNTINIKLKKQATNPLNELWHFI